MENFLRQVYVPRHLGVSARTVDIYGYAIRNLEGFAGKRLKITDLSEDLLLRFLNARLREAAPWTVKRERQTLLTLWRFAYKTKRTKRRPPDDLPCVQVPRRNPVALTPQQVASLVCACAGLRGSIRGTDIRRAVWFASLIQFLYWTGSRVGAALAVRPADIDLERRLVTLRSQTAKTQLEQVVALHEQVIAAIAPLWSPCREFVWPWPYCPRGLWPAFGRLLRRAGVNDDRYHKFHALRRTTYTLACAYGSQDLAARQLGHRTDMSRFYLDRSLVLSRGAADVLPALEIGGNGHQADWSI